MKQPIHVVKLDKYAHNVVVDSLVEKRNKKIQDNDNTENIDEVLLTVLKAPIKNERLKREAYR